MAFVVAAHWHARPGAERRVAEIIGEMTAPSRAEAGCLAYHAQVSPLDPCHFFLYEQYADAAAYESHMASEHFTRLVSGEALRLLEAREREFYETL